MKNNWTSLDNAAKLFPSAITKTETQVFRITCELLEHVDQGILQKAAEDTLKVFPSYGVVLKKGVFWYYLEESDILPTVQEEHKKLCCKMDHNADKNLLFEISYYGPRINLEVYHVLSDGTGAINFLRMLVTKYLSEKHEMTEPELDIDASVSQIKDDSYRKYYTGRKQPRAKHQRACRIQGVRYMNNTLRNITGTMDAATVIAMARENKATITEFLGACMIEAIKENASHRERKKPIVLSVPVNLRTIFPSESGRNFFVTIPVAYESGNEEEETFEDILSSVHRELKEKTTKEKLSLQLDSYSAAEHKLTNKLAPLFLKTWVLRRIYKANMKRVTATISNIGRVSLPESLHRYIRGFDICSATSKLQGCICSFNGLLSISFTNPHLSADIERCFFRKLVKLGAEVEITTNLEEDDR